MDSATFFQWMDKNDIPNSEISRELGIDNRTLSSYKSRGLPKSKLSLAARIVSEYTQKDVINENKINVAFSDDEIDLIHAAAVIVDTPFREYMRRAIIARARQDKKLTSVSTPTLRAAEDETPYTHRTIVDIAKEDEHEANAKPSADGTTPI